MFEDDEDHMKSGKKIYAITVKVDENLFQTLSHLANKRDQKLSDMVRTVMEDHVFGVSKRLQKEERKP